MSRSWFNRRTATGLSVLFAAGLILAPVRRGQCQDAPSTAITTITAPLIAEVNGEKLTQDEFWQLCETALRISSNAGTVGMQVLSEWIQTSVRAQEAKRFALLPTDVEIEERFAAMRRGAGTEKAFGEGLRRQGITVATLRRSIREALVSERLLYRGVTVSEAEVVAEFEGSKGRLTIPERLEISQITLDSPQKLDKARKELAAGKPLSEVATAHSSDAFAKLGGKVPFPLGGQIQAGGPVAPETLRAAGRLKDGQTSEPVRLGATWVMVRLDKRLAAVAPKLEDHREMLRGVLLNRKAQSAGVLRQNQMALNEALVKAEIKIYRPEYAALVELLKQAAGNTVRPR